METVDRPAVTGGDRPAEQALLRYAMRSAVLLRGFVGLAATVAGVMTAPEANALVVGALAANLVWSVVFVAIARVRGLTWWLAAGDVAFLSGLCLIQQSVTVPAALPGAASWIGGLITMTLLIAAMGLPTRWAIPASLVLVVAHLAGIRPADDGVISALIHVIQIIAMAVLMRVLRQSAGYADVELAAVLRDQRAELIERARRADERVQRRDLHDTVLSTLTMVGTAGIPGPSAQLRQRAAADILVLDRLADPDAPALDVPANGLDDRLREIALQADLDVALALTPVEVPAPVVEAIAGATAEAVSNVRRHAGTGRVRINLTSENGAVQVEIRDRGRGFDPQSTPFHRYGVREAIIGRMQMVGGLADVDSMPGAGTTVTLRWWP
ncbi:signal transduction histidine kinase [Catenuloplanes nepalensis]|uniref:Signal transduction histidine kinase n=1 Tax=Catenuloplanes nepalensis TaxID=587533 RepID=A0ABT9N4V6_9ACTN|nr:ATP-binding protein [Catenuloplanes nepalensis]MDP9798728.1 signal transduction histidine kinase [Catenuloplanes nepalensis]